MSWAVGYDSNWHRDVGYGVPALCDHPDCGARIDRGLGHVCGGAPFGGEYGCGLYFCDNHTTYMLAWGSDPGCMQQLCQRCADDEPPFEPTEDVEEWVHHKATDPSWAQWRAEQNTHEKEDAR